MEIIEPTYSISGGIYLVLNPAIDKGLLLAKLANALTGGINVVQIWNNWTAGADKPELIKAIAELCMPYHVPVLINQEWQLLTQTKYLQGVHFDAIPDDFADIKQTIGKPFLAGITCSGDLDTVRWADSNRFDYVSFCSMFQSASAGTCSIVSPATVTMAREITTMPLFVSGGITPENAQSLKAETEFDGVAVISGILSADDPEQKVKQYHNALSINK
jgi:thiamine-phosphate pyrophosphorylase